MKTVPDFHVPTHVHPLRRKSFSGSVATYVNHDKIPFDDSYDDIKVNYDGGVDVLKQDDIDRDNNSKTIDEMMLALSSSAINNNNNNNNNNNAFISSNGNKKIGFRDRIKLSFRALFGWLSVVDWVTDIIVLSRIAQYNSDSDNKEKNVTYLTISLFVSILSSYIVSYSSGVKLFLKRKTLDNLDKQTNKNNNSRFFDHLKFLFFLLPTGIFYFMFLECIEIILSIVRLFLILFLGYSMQQLKNFEETVSLQFGMNRMNWEGFRRQRSITQLIFESLPQLTIQSMIVFEIINISQVIKTNKIEIYISLVLISALRK